MRIKATGEDPNNLNCVTWETVMLFRAEVPSVV